MSHPNGFPLEQGPMPPGYPLPTSEVLPAAIPEHPLAGPVGEIKANTDKLVLGMGAGILATGEVARQVNQGNTLLGDLHTAVGGVESAVATGTSTLSGEISGVGTEVRTGLAGVRTEVGTGFTGLGADVRTGFSDVGSRVDTVGRTVAAGATHVGDRVDELRDLIDQRLPAPRPPMTPADYFNAHLGVQAELSNRDARFKASKAAQKAGLPPPVDGFELPPVAASYSQSERRGLLGLRTLARVLGRSAFLRSISPSQLPLMDWRRRGSGWLPPDSKRGGAERDYSFNTSPAVGNGSRRSGHHRRARARKDEVIEELRITDAAADAARRARF